MVVPALRYACFASFCILAGCTTTAQVRGDFCKLTAVHSFNDKAVDAMTEEEAARELAFNELGAALCGWKPKEK